MVGYSGMDHASAYKSSSWVSDLSAKPKWKRWMCVGLMIIGMGTSHAGMLFRSAEVLLLRSPGYDKVRDPC